MPSHYLNQCWNIVNLNLRNTFQWILKRNSYIFIHKNPFENVIWKMAVILAQLECVHYWIVVKQITNHYLYIDHASDQHISVTIKPGKLSQYFLTPSEKHLPWCIFTILLKSFLQPFNKNTHKANHWVYNPSISYDGKQSRPQGAISSGANKIFISKPMLISLKGWGWDHQENTVNRGSSCKGILQCMK